MTALAAPAAGLLTSMLGFTEEMVGLMIATYIAIDSFGTATNVTGDAAIAMVVDKLSGEELHREVLVETEDGQLVAVPDDGEAYLRDNA